MSNRTDQPIMNQPSRPSPVPTENPLQGGARRYVESITLLRNIAGTGSYTNLSAQFEIWHPSTRLMACATFGFLPDTGEDVVIPAGWVLSMDAWGKTSRSGQGQGRRIRGNNIIPGPFALPTQLPLSYEAITGVDQWRGSVSVPDTGTGLQTTGYLMLTVTWEPAAGTQIPDVELERLFQTCKVFGGSSSPVFGGG